MDETRIISWEKFVARQPILNQHRDIVAYELLFRNKLENFFESSQPDRATLSLMVSSYLLLGIQTLTGGRPAYLNFTQNLLVGEYPTFLPPDQTVIEILENVQPDDSVVEACKSLKRLGYKIALDDYPLDGHMDPLLPYADIVKVDWLNTPLDICRKLAEKLIPRNILLLAEKVETYEQYHQAMGMKYQYFQGFFFCEPEILSGRDIPLLHANCLLLLREVNKEEPDLAAVERILMREPSLCYKLLRYLNSAIYCFLGTISSIRHALSLLGTQESRKWISIVTLASMGENKSDALVVASVIRAKFCECIGKTTGQGHHRTEELFLTGLFSLVDAILDKPMDALLDDLPLSDDIKNTLLGKDTCYQAALGLVCAYERSNWDQVSMLAETLNLHETDVTQAYMDAIVMSQEFVQSDTPGGADDLEETLPQKARFG
jgi:c-di-GMP-related signal transduction protein